MADIPDAAEIAKLTGLLAPGIVILWVRSRFRDAALPKLADKMTSYAVVSIAYNAAAYPIFHVESGVSLPSWLWQILMYIVLPLIVGISLVFFDKSERFYTFAEWAGLRPIHHTPTAWDYTFRKREPSYALIHLNDGSLVAGEWAGGSFASSTSGDRDVYLEKMYKLGEDGSWNIIDPARSILICAGAIRLIEFIKGGSHE